VKIINVGLIGWGTVGTGVAKILLNQEKFIRDHERLSLRLCKIADLDITTDRGFKIPQDILTTNVNDVLKNPDIDIVVELIGGLKPASEFIFSALKEGKHVVTANKAVLATHGKNLFQTAKENKAMIKFEASVGGCIPIIGSLLEGMAANNIHAIYGIVNGTCNYMLTQMAHRGIDFDTALKEAQGKGYAEAKPDYDIEGIDAANKIVILTSLAYETEIKLDDIYIEGITKITQNDIQYAREFGYQIKLLAIAKLMDDNKIQIRVHPTMLPKDTMLAGVEGVFNAIYVLGNATGATMFYGRGAGQMPAASAVVGDIINVAKSIIAGTDHSLLPQPTLERTDYALKPMSECLTRYYIRLQALDKPGVLAKVTGILGNHDISISSVIQKERKEGESVTVIMMTHEAIEKNAQSAIQQINDLDVITEKAMMIRVENMEGEEESLAIV
jgi:homoserine dehydrogenase